MVPSECPSLLEGMGRGVPSSRTYMTAAVNAAAAAPAAIAQRVEARAATAVRFLALVVRFSIARGITRGIRGETGRGRRNTTGLNGYGITRQLDQLLLLYRSKEGRDQLIL
uniref:Uncharacterized protein n=1 Tax=Pristionchus pacificus TaxID=54126 RepID=A0A2A6BUK5_PRIPA|eukprot:PDM69600.1 hypothetical protein PRIPAC_44696 [Pristionchus pacificus]